MNEHIERVLAMLDGFRMSDEMTYSAYSTLHDEISLLDDLLKGQTTSGWTSVKEQEPVVRCKDCKHQDPDRFDDGEENYVCRKGHGWKPDNWFCADGERR